MALVACVVLAAPVTAFANMITTFTVSGAFDASGFGVPLSFDPNSTITIDTTTGLATNAKLILRDLAAHTLTFTGAPGGHNTPTEYDWGLCASVFFFCFPGELALQNTNGTGFMNFAGGPLTGGWLYDHAAIPLPDNEPANAINAIVLTPLNQVPEPNSLAIFAVALVGLVAARGRKREMA